MIDSNLLGTNEYWETSYNRLMLKSNISEADKILLTKYMSFERDTIINTLLDGTYEWSVPRKLLINKHGTNKKRTVYVYNPKDRLILGVLYHALTTEFANRISPYCYSYKTGISTNDAIKFIRDYSTDIKYYGVKLDIHAYFNSVNKETLVSVINNLFPKKSGFKKTIENLFYSDEVTYKGELIQEYKSLTPGCPVASFLANYCLKDLDFYFQKKGVLYARYSDDIIILENTKEKVDEDLAYVKSFITNLGLEINPDKYEYFSPEDDITFLGLKLCSNGKIDISDHAKAKIKKEIHRWCRKGRKDIEMYHSPYLGVCKKINNKINNKNFKCYIRNEGTFGWCHYAFRYITTTDTLKELDLYTKERLRYVKTGKNNKANFKKVSEEEFKEMGWVSLVQLFHLYKKDFDYYCEVISLL